MNTTIVTRGRPPGPDPSIPRIGSAHGGFTLVEVMFAVMVLAVGVLGLAGTTAYIVRQITLGGVMSARATALQTTIEKIQSTPFVNVGSGTDSLGSYAIRWSSTLETAGSKIVTIVTVGPGLQSTAANPFPALANNVADTFQYRVISR